MRGGRTSRLLLHWRRRTGGRIPQDEAILRASPLGGASEFLFFQQWGAAEREGRGQYAKQPRVCVVSKRGIGAYDGVPNSLHLEPGIGGLDC